VLGNEVDARAAWRDIIGWMSVLRAANAAQRQKRPRALLDVLSKKSARVELQEFVVGIPANRAILCDKGKIIAAVSVIACETVEPKGSASVVRVIEHAEMAETASILARRLSISGFCGFDFVISSSTGGAYLLEVNPRVTPICHFAFSNGTYLP